MPRVDGTYAAPYPDVIPDTTIESEVHNGTVADLVLDANAARPITAGGTGATSPAAARDNLDAMVAGAQVTNYDSHVFESGGFWSYGSATGAPVGANPISGIASVFSPDRIALRATDLTTGLAYTRLKNTTWEPWVEAASDKVSKTGDTMSGQLTLPGSPTAPLHAIHKQYVDDAINSAIGLFSSELRFARSSSQHMTRLYGTMSSSAWTLSMWVKRVGLGTHQALFGVESTTDAGKLHIAFDASNNLTIYGGAAGNTPIAVGSTPHTSTTLWLNIVWTAAAGAPSSPRFHNVYVNNGAPGGALISGNGLNNAETHYIGQPGYYPDVIMKEVMFVDGAEVLPTSFGESVGGVWTTKPYSGTFGANGFRLNFGNHAAPSSTNLGRDISGNNNHWTAVNFP